MLPTKYEIIQGNTFELIKALTDNSIDLLITSPPYNVGKAYEKEVNFNIYLDSYVEFVKVVFTKISSPPEDSLEGDGSASSVIVVPLQTPAGIRWPVRAAAFDESRNENPPGSENFK